MRNPQKILVIDVGGEHVKCLATGQKTKRQIPSGPKMTARQMVNLLAVSLHRLSVRLGGTAELQLPFYMRRIIPIGW